MLIDRALFAAAAGFILAAVLSTCAERADAHDAPSGWSYPRAAARLLTLEV